MFCYSQIDVAPPRRQNAPMALNIRIREIRKARRMTLAQLADEVAVSTPHISEVERGLKNLNNHLLERIARALGVTPSDLISDGRDSIQISELVARLDARDKARVAAFAEALLKSQEETKQS
jgi:transcriptional regulator with XRE-family HTH domain